MNNKLLGAAVIGLAIGCSSQRPAKTAVNNVPVFRERPAAIPYKVASNSNTLTLYLDELQDDEPVDFEELNSKFRYILELGDAGAKAEAEKCNHLPIFNSLTTQAREACSIDPDKLDFYKLQECQLIQDKMAQELAKCIGEVYRKYHSR